MLDTRRQDELGVKADRFIQIWLNHVHSAEIVNVDSEDSYSSEDLGNLGSPSENEVNGSAKRLKDLSLDSDQAISV